MTTTEHAGPETQAADTVEEFRLAEQRHAQNVQRVHQTRIAEECAQNAAFTGEGTGKHANPKRPFLSWQCCDVHRQLAVERAEILSRAARLGVESAFGPLPKVNI